MSKHLNLARIGIVGIIGLLGITTPNVIASSYSYGTCEPEWNCLTIQKIPGVEADKEWGFTDEALNNLFNSWVSKVKIIFDEEDETTGKTKLMGFLKSLETFYKNEPVEKQDKMTKALKRINKIKVAVNSKYKNGLVIDDELYLELKTQLLDRINKPGLAIERIDVRGPLDLSNISVENLKSLIKRSGGAFRVKRIYAGVIKTNTYDRADVILDEIGLDHVSTSAGWPDVEADAGISIVGNASSDMKKVKIPWRPNPWNSWTLTADKIEKANSKLLAAHSSQITAEDILAAWDITIKDAKGKLTANMNMGVEITIGVPAGTEETFVAGNYFIYNRHGNKTEKIEETEYSATTKTVSFKSFKFSEFVVTTKNLDESGSPTSPTAPPATNPATPTLTEPTTEPSNNTTTLGAPNTGLAKTEKTVSRKATPSYWQGMTIGLVMMLGFTTILNLIINKVIQKK